MRFDSDLRVHVVKRSGRKFFEAYFKHPTTDRVIRRSTKQTSEAKARDFAAEWKRELVSGGMAAKERMTWQAFREKFERYRFPHISGNSCEQYTVSFDRFEQLIGPKYLNAIDAEVLEEFVVKLEELTHKNGKRMMGPVTIKCRIRHLGAALNWARRKKYLRDVPDLPSIDAAKGVTKRGRAITAEEFDRLIAAVPKIVERDPGKWERLLWGLWLSGLRISEALSLSWEWSAPFAVNMEGKRPCIVIAAQAQKNRKEQRLPLTPDFVAFLEAVPEQDREGLVFDMRPGCDEQIIPRHASKKIAMMGKAAGIIVNPTTQKFASAHDLRRSFATRWAPRVNLKVLQKLMRHADPMTTQKYYECIECDEIGDLLDAQFGGKNVHFDVHFSEPKKRNQPRAEKTLVYKCG